MTIRVMVFPAGEMNSVELCFALSKQVNIQLYGASSVERMGRHLFSNYRNDLPMINDPGFIRAFSDLLSEWNIDVVIPTHDSVVEFLSDHRDAFPCKLLIPSERTALACRDKAYAMEIFSGAPFVPAVFKSQLDLPSGVFFVKPKRGQGAVGARKIITEDGVPADIDWETELACEYLPGDELTVDCFTDRKGALLGVFPRSRGRVLGGISVAGETLAAGADIQSIADIINTELDFLGLWFFQIKRAEDGAWKLLEISARCSGTQCLTRARGVNLPLLSVYAAMGIDVTVSENDVALTMDRFLVPMFDFEYEFETAYVDYDDTLVHKSGVDSDIIGLIYQFKRDGVRIILITRHAEDIGENMNRHCISSNLFDQIIHITNEDRKSLYINPERAIFIDNAFVERREVQQNLGIPVFDVEGVHVLKKWLQ